MHRLKTSKTVSAPGRVCFAGEDIDWISGPSILCAIGLRICSTVSLLPKNCQELLLKSEGPFNIEHHVPLTHLGQYKNNVMDYTHAAVKLIRDRGVTIPPLKIVIKSNLPASAGLSSSAAVSLSTCAALNEFFGLSLSISEICNLAYSIEGIELNTGAGQMDFYSCAFGGAIYVDSSHVPPRFIEKYKFPAGLRIIIIDTLSAHSTKNVIRWKRERLSNGDQLIREYIKHTEIAIAEMRYLFKQTNFDTFSLGKLITSCHSYLRDYMLVSTDLLNACVEVALKCGALGAKLTGTGMGGCAFALADRAKTELILESLRALPVRIYVTNVSTKGIVIH